MPNPICSPPNPAASQTLPHAGGVRMAAMPKTMNAAPISRTAGTLKMPPVSTPAP